MLLTSWIVTVGHIHVLLHDNLFRLLGVGGGVMGYDTAVCYLQTYLSKCFLKMRTSKEEGEKM